MSILSVTKKVSDDSSLTFVDSVYCVRLVSCMLLYCSSPVPYYRYISSAIFLLCSIPFCFFFSILLPFHSPSVPSLSPSTSSLCFDSHSSFIFSFLFSLNFPFPRTSAAAPTESDFGHGKGQFWWSLGMGKDSSGGVCG